MSEIKKYKDGSYSIPQKFVNIVHFPIQALLDLRGYDLLLPDKLTEDGQETLARFCFRLGREGLMIVELHKELQKHAWNYFHEVTKESKDRIFTINLKTQRIVPKDDGCNHSEEDHEEQLKDFVLKMMGAIIVKRITKSNRHVAWPHIRTIEKEAKKA